MRNKIQFSTFGLKVSSAEDNLSLIVSGAWSSGDRSMAIPELDRGDQEASRDVLTMFVMCLVV